MKLTDVYKSRTIWTIVILFLIGGVEGIREYIPNAILPVATAVLSALAIWFRIKPRV